MANLGELWQGLTPVKRAMVALFTAVTLVAILAMSQMGGRAKSALLYAGLDPRAAGEVMTALDQAGGAYEVRGDAIYVDETMRDRLRMQLAGQGIPASGGAGYELLDGLSGFGTTSQMFDTAYWRAKEGELARTILAMPQVRSARVHLSQSNNAFLRDRAMSASVTVSLALGKLSGEQANALRHLVASATGNMQASDVAVIDAGAGLIAPMDAKAQQEADSKAIDIKRNVERLLFARVGPDRAVVEVSIDVVTEREAITERVFDPQGRVVISSESQQRAEKSNDKQDAVTVASNLPEGDANAAGSQSQSDESRERVNFEVSNTQREVLREPGAVRRLTIAVLVDGQQIRADDGSTSWQPRTAEELADLRDLVASAAGIDEARGDVLTLKSLEFSGQEQGGTLAEAIANPILGPIDVATLVKILVLGAIVMAFLTFVLRPILLRKTLPPVLAPTALAALEGAAGRDALSGEFVEDFSLPNLPMIDFNEHGMIADGPVDPVAKLRQLMGERQAESMEILRGWMELEEEQG